MELKFKVESFRKIPNPYLVKGEGEKRAMMYIAICDVKNIPDCIPMETNPRKQKLTTGVPKKIKASLLDESYLDFYLLNRGLCISASDVTFNNYSNEIRIVFDDPEFHGDVDGGHTYKVILENRDKLDFGKQFVKLEILTGIEDIFQRLAAARNTSTQVQDKSIAELENRFEIIKRAIEKEKYASDIYFEENDQGDIDVSDILAILNMFNIDLYPDMEKFPTASYSAKQKCIRTYIDYHKKLGDGGDNPYVKMMPIMTDIFELYDQIEVNMGKYYKEKFPKGKYGTVKGVAAMKNGEYYQSKFYKTDMDYTTPTGFIYPILGSFRALLKEENHQYTWRKDPFAVLDDLGGELVMTTVERSRTLGNNPQSVGKDTGNWKTLYMTVKLGLLE
ncbi:MAG: hypothetical protein HFH53_01075 [Hespellia sp.]|nr:hypothetical protein [Hespellia sp.]